MILTFKRSRTIFGLFILELTNSTILKISRPIKDMKFIKKIRELNRKRNYFKKRLKYKIALYKATKKWHREPSVKISPSEVRTVLMIRNEGKIGDAIVSTCILRTMHEAGISIDVLAIKANEMVFSDNPFIRKIYLTEEMDYQDRYNHAIPDDLINTLKENNYDLMIDTGIWDTGLYMPHMIQAISPKISLGFNKEKWLSHYDVNIRFNHYEHHVKEIYARIINYLGVPSASQQRYEVYYKQSITDEVKAIDFFKKESKKVIINMYASHNDRNLTPQQTQEIISGVLSKNKDADIMVLDYKKNFINDFFHGAYVYHVPSFYHAMATINLADVVISPDTAVVHVAAMYDKPLIGIYRDISDNNKLWSPGYKNGHQIFTSTFVVGEDALLVDNVLNAIDKFDLN
ncbi:glycosyltransferase family 9 protein [Pantoea sp. GCM10028869]|uniref:glycosyltransferase family 9 protein n=1 Tax=Pantoea sp. GCM10028869 TaxID=3273417 RepID=UPI00361C7B49